MRHAGLLAPVGLLLTLAACESDPALYEGEVYDDSVYAATVAMVKLEICNDGIDNDGDYKVDRLDPDCGTTAYKAGPTLGYSGTIVEGGDIHPGWRVSMTLDGKTVTIDHRTSSLVVKTSTGTVLATIYTDSEASGVAIGKRSTAYYQDLIVVTEGGGAAYAPGRVGGTYDLHDPAAAPAVPPSGSTICTIGC